MNQEPNDLAFAACQNCGQQFTYEPIWFNGHDLAKCLHLWCSPCGVAVEEQCRLDRIAERKARIEAEICQQIPPDLLATDPRYPSFNQALWSAVSKWRPNEREGWLGIVGAAGKSKTRCMALLAQRAMRNGIRCTWTTANRLKDASADRSHRERSISILAREHLAECLTAPWLFLDDLGKNEWTPAFESQFFQILDHRKNHRLPIVFSSNAHPEAFSQLISGLNASPIIGRLLDRTTLLDLLA